MKKDIEKKKIELFDLSVRIQEKNRLLLDLEQQLKLLRSGSCNSKDINKLNQSLKNHLIDESNRGIIEEKVMSAHHEFLEMLKSKYKTLSKEDLNLIGLLKIGLSSKQISEIYNTSERAIEGRRYRLRKKLELEKGENLVDYINSIN